MSSNHENWRVVLILLFFLTVSPGICQGQNLSNTLSNITVYTAIGLDTIDSYKHDDKKKAFICQGMRLGVSNAVNFTVKQLVHKRRPDGSDDKSFYSNHTSNAAVSSGWNWYVGIPLAITTGGLRISAKKHDYIDVTVGMLAGLAATQVCDK